MRHFFTAWEIGPFATAWKCQNCKMRVSNRTVARRLEGERCYG